MKVNKVSILGFGRFGKTLYRLLSADFTLTLYDSDSKAFKDVPFTKNTIIAKDISEIYLSDVVFYCVPISSFEKVISTHRKFFKDQLLVDVLSVKEFPRKIFSKHVKGSKARALLTHPMFGPDSSKDGFVGLPIVLDKFLANEEEYKFWKSYFLAKGLKIIEMNSKEHDKVAARSHGVAHLIGRLLGDFKFKSTEMDTRGVSMLHELMRVTCNDKWELFLDLQRYNEHTPSMRKAIKYSFDRINKKISEKSLSGKSKIYGIQGGKCSFNEEAIKELLAKKGVGDYQIKYLFTTEKVLKAINNGSIDYGLFAITNSIGGLVEETIKVIGKYNFQVIDRYSMQIRHFLMKRKDVLLKDITTIIAHPEVLKQCKNTLNQRYANLKSTSGKGEYIDTARVARALFEGQLPKTTVILGPKGLSDLYNFDIVDSNLQDNESNITTFLLVKRI